MSINMISNFQSSIPSLSTCASFLRPKNLLKVCVIALAVMGNVSMATPLKMYDHPEYTRKPYGQTTVLPEVQYITGRRPSLFMVNDTSDPGVPVAYENPDNPVTEIFGRDPFYDKNGQRFSNGPNDPCSIAFEQEGNFATRICTIGSSTFMADRKTLEQWGQGPIKILPEEDSQSFGLKRCVLYDGDTTRLTDCSMYEGEIDMKGWFSFGPIPGLITEFQIQKSPRSEKKAETGVLEDVMQGVRNVWDFFQNQIQGVVQR